MSGTCPRRPPRRRGPCLQGIHRHASARPQCRVRFSIQATAAQTRRCLPPPGVVLASRPFLPQGSRREVRRVSTLDFPALGSVDALPPRDRFRLVTTKEAAMEPTVITSAGAPPPG